MDVTSPIGFWSSKWAELAAAILAAHHSRIIQSGQKSGMWEELVAETTPNKHEAAAIHLSLKWPRPPIMQNFKV